MSLNDQFKNAKKNAEDLNAAMGDTQDSFRDMRSLLEGINEELGKKVNNVREASKGYTDLTAVASKLALQEEEITRYSDAQLKGFKEKALAARKEIEERAKSLIQEKGINEELKGNIPMLNQILGFRKDLTAEQQALLTGYANNFDLEKEVVKKVQEEVRIREDVNEAIGVAGKALKAITEIAGPFASILKLDKIKEDMEKFAEETIRAGGSVSRLQTLGVGLGSAFKNAFSTLTDPTVILAGAIKGFGQVDKANVAFGRQTGQNLNTFSTAIDASNTHFITMADYIRTASELTKELGQNATAIFGPEDLMEAAEMTEAMGMTAKEAANLSKFSKINGGNIKAQNEALVKGVNASNAQNRTAVAAGDILKDVANVSEEIAISYAGYPESLASAAATAKGLGMELSDVDKIAGSLLNFEQSISNELEAELLTGQSLNLEKARELALANDLEGVAKELSSQGITSAKFSQMNRIQQEAQAKALGMNRQEMAKMLLAQEIKNGLSEDALTDAQKQTLEQLKQQEASEKFNTSIQKIQQALAPIVGFFANILSSVTGFLTQTYLIYPILGVIALSYVGKMVKGFKGMKDDLANMVKSAKDIAINLFDKGKEFFGLGGGEQSEGIGSKIKEKAKEKAEELANSVLNKGEEEGGGIEDKVKEKTEEKAEELADSVLNKGEKEAGDQMEPGKSKGIKENLQGLGEGLKAMAGGKVTQGILNLALAGPALILALPSIPFLTFIGLTPLSQISSNLENLSQGLENMSGAKVLQGIGNLALAGASLLLALPSIPFLLFIGLTPLSQISSNLENLSQGLENMSGAKVLQGIGNLALAGASLLLALPSIPFLTFIGLTPLSQISSNLENLSQGLENMSGAKVLQGIGNLALAGASLLLALPSIPFLTFMALPLGPLIQSGLTGLANGLSYLGRNFANVLLGSVALGAVGLALGGSFALAMMVVKDVDPAQMIAFAGSLTMLGLTMALLGNIGANVILGAAAMGILALSLIPAAFAFSLLAGVDVGSMIAFSVALPLLALAAAGLGFLAPFIIFGSVALAALGTALIPAAEAFGNLARVDVGSISAFSAGIYDLAYSVAGLGFLAPAIAFGGIALEALGASLEVLSVGFSALESVDTGALISGLTGLASLGPGLTETATALFAVAGGMGAFALTGFLALPVIGALTALGAVSEGLSSIFGGGGEEKSDEGSMKAIEQKLDQLIAVVSKGGDVYIDGSKVGKTLQLASSKMG